MEVYLHLPIYTYLPTYPHRARGSYSVASWRHAIVAAHKSNRFPFDRRDASILRFDLSTERYCVTLLFTLESLRTLWTFHFGVDVV